MGTEAEPSDATLVSRMARGDRAALGALYERHAARLAALAERMLGEREEAADLVHEVFLEAWRRAEDYASERGSVSTWLSLRTRSRAIDRRRAAPRARTQALSPDLLASAADPDADPTRISDHERLKRALGDMSVDEQQVIFLGYFEGLSSSEIAERVGAPIGTVKSRTRAALSKLRSWFAETGGDAS